MKIEIVSIHGWKYGSTIYKVTKEMLDLIIKTFPKENYRIHK